MVTLHETLCNRPPVLRQDIKTVNQTHTNADMGRNSEHIVKDVGLVLLH